MYKNTLLIGLIETVETSDVFKLILTSGDQTLESRWYSIR
jgi:predicted Zn-dependent protease